MESIKTGTIFSTLENELGRGSVRVNESRGHLSIDVAIGNNTIATMEIKNGTMLARKIVNRGQDDEIIIYVAHDFDFADEIEKMKRTKLEGTLSYFFIHIFELKESPKTIDME